MGNYYPPKGSGTMDNPIRLFLRKVKKLRSTLYSVHTSLLWPDSDHACFKRIGSMLRLKLSLQKILSFTKKKKGLRVSCFVQISISL
jgi:hypothetical protein